VRFASVVLLALLLIGLAGCSATQSASQIAPVAATSAAAPSRAAAIQSLTIAELKPGSAQPAVGSVLASASLTPIVNGHVLFAAPSATAGQPDGTYSGVSVTLDSLGAEQFAKWSAAHHGKQFVILFGGKVAAAPIIGDTITSGQLDIRIDDKSILGRDLIRAAIDSQQGRP
jgi:preprotein translocase subunit SecD